MTRPGSLAAAVVAALALAACGEPAGGGAERRDGSTVVETTTTRVEVVEDVAGDGGAFDPRTIYKRESPGVVTVMSVFSEAGLESLLRGGGGDRGDSGLGSGFVLNGEGEIVTNAHVVTSGEADDIKKARQVYVQFADGNRVSARIVGYDPNADIALLKIDPAGLELNPLPLGTDESVEVGEPVAAMGSPFGEEQSLSVGVVSAVERDVQSLTSFAIAGAIQTDAAINPGNSGGPLVDARGRVIGVNQQIRTTSGGGEGVGFAVPVDLVKRSVEQLREEGEVRYAYLGVSSSDVYPQLAERFDLPVDDGAWLQDVTPGGPGARAGLRGGGEREVTFQAGRFKAGGDVVVRVGDTPIEDANDLADAIAHLRPGQTVAVEVYRGEDKRTVQVRLGERPLTVEPPRGR
ncbi:MAG TPA: trypsin-like peptidase domain-containing protein [Solirubrobacteraceae bacterium]|nr:trypsin-like peptidase domain-containing protein [Solirubrobacteraceae bacterium]